MATCVSSWSLGFAAVATPCPRRAAGSIISASRCALGSRYTARLIPSPKSSSPRSSHCDKFATYWRRSAKATDGAKIRKILKVEPMSDQKGAFFNFVVSTKLDESEAKVCMVLTGAEYLTLRSSINNVIPYLMGSSKALGHSNVDSASSSDVQARGNLFGRRESLSIDQTVQPGVTGVETSRLPKNKHNYEWKDSVLSAKAGESKGHSQQAGRACGNVYMPSARTTSEAIAILKRRQQQGNKLDSYAFVDVLKQLKQKDFTAAREVHDCMIQSGMDKIPHVANTLLSVYIRCRRLEDARGVFDGLDRKTDVTWSIMIGGYAKNDHAEHAMALFNQMRRAGAQPNELTCLSILKACTNPLALKWGEEVHDYIRKAGLESEVRIGTALIQMYAKCGCMTEARGVFEKLDKRDVMACNVMIGAYATRGTIAEARLIFDRFKKRDIITWNVMIGAYADSGFGKEAYRLFLQMKEEGFLPNAVTYINILKASASAGALKWVKEVHKHALSGGLEEDLRVGNSLIHMYAKSGSLDDARVVFDRLKTRDVTTWTIMIGAYAGCGCGEKAYQLFLQMQREGFVPNPITYVSILNPSASAGALEWVKAVHSHAREAGLESDLRVGSALVHMYAKCGSMHDARVVFDRMVTRSEITWNIMIGAYAESGCGFEAYRLLVQMEREGFTPDAFTYASILNAAASAGALEWVKNVHSRILKAGLESDLRVGSALVHMYAKSGSIGDARQVFDRIENRDVILWNILIGAYAESGSGVEAYQCFLQMKRESFVPNAFTYLSILNSSAASAGALDWVKAVHSHALEAGLLESDLRVGNALVHMYSKCGSIGDARLVFEGLQTRDVTSWTVMIGAYAESGCGLEAYNLFLEMQREGLQPNAVTYMSILNPSASAGALDWVKAVHLHALEAGLESDLRVGSALVHMYAKCGSIGDARVVFDRMGTRNEIVWNMMIGAYAESGCGVEAYQLLEEMERKGFEPDAFTYASILNAPASAGGLEWVKDVHSRVLRAGMESDFRVGGALVLMYAKSGVIGDARLVFDRMVTRNAIIWNIMIGAYAESGHGVEAYRLFVQMEREGFNPDVITYVNILNANASAGAFEWVKAVQTHALEAGLLESDLRVGNALVHMFAKSGSIDDARLVFETMVNRDVVTWNTMVGGLAQHGCGHEALELFRKMKADGVNPDETTFVAVLSACCHSGLIDDGRRVFLAMMPEYGIEPCVVHYTCMVDLLGRAGQLEEARSFIGGMPVKPDGVTWRALLGACRTYGNVEVGELAAEEVLKLEPQDAAAYVLLSNIYAAAGMWDKVSSVRKMMQERGARKERGRSWIEVDSKVHEFVVGDTSHPETEEIYDALDKLTEKLKAEGYVPDTQQVLQDIDEADKELALCSHSEKLAIAYGLLHIPLGKAIRVQKNLRVCSDCHTATKVISKVTGRDIIARDANRFHHFKDGVCSCGDYW